ncbi:MULTISPECIES: ATP-binding protein [Streptomyces]|uniref:ATP-binding protein n=1 Tax=Streptomyces sudanensis TaxID=436397 RepID=A0ABY4TIC9_9ACTN|nr:MULTISPECIES: ATP-binding protein [Streptomyces]URN16735.1 ATP-binding protein [Streptomyces sudanensis]
MPFTVTPPWAYVLQLPQHPCGPGIARSTVRTVLAAHGMQALTAVAELVTSELATNAYLYSDTPYSLHLYATEPGRLRVSVWDSNPHIPAPFRGGTAVPARDDDDEHGRGLRLVELCADDFGAHPLGDGPFRDGGPSGDGNPFGDGGGKLLWADCAAPVAEGEVEPAGLRGA